MSLGLYIGRLNPPHIWHIGIIKKALLENDKVLVLLWSPILQDEENPLNFEQRKSILNKKFWNNDRLIILEIKDNESDLVWIYQIYKALYDNGDNIRDVKFYAWDIQNDSACLVLKEYEDKLINHKIEYIDIFRENSFIEHDWKKYPISATNLRKALRGKDYRLASKFCDDEIFEEIKKYFK